MKTAAKVTLIAAAVFILLGIALTVGGIALNGKIDTVLQNIDGDLNMNFRVGTDGIHFGHGPSARGDDIFDDDAPYLPDDFFDDDHDDRYDESDFMDDLEDAFEDVGISERKLHELMDKYNISESDIKEYMKKYNMTPDKLEGYLRAFNVNENNVENFINSFLNGEF